MTKSLFIIFAIYDTIQLKSFLRESSMLVPSHAAPSFSCLSETIVASH